MKHDLEDITEKYIRAAKAHGEASEQGDFKQANKQYSILKKIYLKLQKNADFAKRLLDPILEHDNPFVKTWAAAHALGLKINIEKAKKVLEEVAYMDNIGVVRLDAEMTLKQWEENGYLSF